MRISHMALSNVSIGLLVFVMLCSMKPWFAWNSGVYLYIALSLFIILRVCLSTIRIQKKYIVSIILCFFLYTTLDLPHMTSIKSVIEYIFRHILFVSLLVLMNLSEKQKTMRWFVNVYVVVLALSVVLYFFYILGVNIPSYSVQIDDSYYSWGFKNYLFLVIPNSLVDFRFQSIFLEPGHVGMIASIFLYYEKYNFKNIRGFVLLISVILSFSLAAYLLLLIGYIIYKAVSANNLFSYLLKCLLGIILVIISSVIIYRSFPNSFFSELIVSRLQYDEEKGFSGNNRTTYEFDKYYEDFYNSSLCLLGEGEKLAEKVPGGGNSSYKVFIASYGIIGILSLLLFFCHFVYNSHSRFICGLLILYIISFWQRPYALWEIELVSFIFISEIFRDCESCKQQIHV